MTQDEMNTIVLMLKEQFESEGTLDSEDIIELFSIIDLLNQKSELHEKIIREGRHIISG